jgi:hypothetical protein
MLKLLVFIFVFSILFILRELFFIIKAYYQKTQYDTTNKRLLILALSIAYIFTIITTGFKF